MKTSIRNQTTLLFLGLMTAAATASATTVFTQDFDGAYTSSGFAFNSGGYNAGGSPTATANAVLSSGGNPNGSFEVAMTATTSGDGWAGQLFFNNLTLPDPNMADYTLQFDAEGSYAATLTTSIRGFSGVNQNGTSDWYINPVPTSLTKLNAANTWQTFTLGFGAIGVPTTTVAEHSLQFNLKIFQSGWGGGAKIGTPNDLYVDNVILSYTPVPEPGTFALLGLGVAALLVFRRK